MGLSALTRLFVLFGFGSGCCGGILPIGLWRLLELVDFWSWSVMVPLDMGLCTFWWIVLLLWGFGGVLRGSAAWFA